MSSPRRFRWSSRRSTTTEEAPDAAPSVVELYKIAVDEYRFQVNLNWSRTQYFIALNLALFGVATTLLADRVTDAYRWGGAIAVYVVGALCCVLSVAAGRVQRRYYRAARDRMKTLEEQLRMGAFALDTTPGMGGLARRFGRVHRVHAVIVTAMLVLDLLGLAAAVTAG